MRNADHGLAAFQTFPQGPLGFTSPSSSAQAGQGGKEGAEHKRDVGSMAHM